MAKPTLEGLPIELQIDILLNSCDVKSLKSLVSASPSYHRAYLLVRGEVLHAVLHNYYDGLVDIAEAIAAVRSRGLYAYQISNHDKIIALLDGRRRSEEIRRLNSPSLKFLPDRPATVDEIMELMRLHDMAVFLLDDFTRTVSCPAWVDRERWKNDILPLELSRTEKKRLFRAFYRLQTYGNIFGAIETPLGAEPPNGRTGRNEWHGGNGNFSDEEAWRLFFGTMAPWEVEEFGCLWEHCYERWVEPYSEVSENLANSGVMFVCELPAADRPPATRMVLDTDDLRLCEMDNRDCFVSMGPAFLVKILREQNFTTRRNLVIGNADGTASPFTEFWPRWSQDHPFESALPLLYPADRFNVGTDMDALKEILRSLPPREQPNLAWSWKWLDDHRDYPEVFFDMFDYGARAQRWKWSYAFWDDERLYDWGTPSDYMSGL